MTAPSMPLAGGLTRIAAQTAAHGPGLHVMPTLSAARCPILPGAFSFRGEVDVITTPAPSRVVRLHDRASGKVVRETVTDAAGLYSFPGVSDLRDYYIVALDTQPGGYDDVIAGPRVPA